VPMILMKPKLNMLIIDDDRTILRVFKRILEKKGYNVATAETGKQAQEQLETHSYVAALIDLKLPDMEGTDLLPRMRQVAPQMMRIVITGMPYAESAQNATQAGADFFLEKPVKPEILLAVLEKGLRGKVLGTP
jgi:two-component system, NtrC family, response regulator